MSKAATQLQMDQDQVRNIPVEQLVRSQFETRKSIDPAALAELADSIRTKGVIEPLIVRPMPQPNSPLERANAHPLFEIGAGQRRWEASKLAGKTTVPSIIRELCDDEFRELGIVSNLQRQDLEPLDEAEAYGRLLELPGATIETVAAKVAKAPSYVGRRVQLLKAIEPVRAALKAGAIEVGHALELARLDEARQRQMLTRLEQFRAETGQQNDEWWKTAYSVVELRREIAETAHVDLKSAPFPLVADLAPMACSDCPKRAGNAQLLFEDCAQDTCTDRGCYYRKVNAWIEGELQAAKDEKRKLLKLTGGWTSYKDKVYCSDYSSARVMKAAAECEHGEEGIWIDGRDVGKRAMVCRNANCNHGGGSRSNSSQGSSRPPKSEKEKAGRRKVIDKVKSEKAYRTALAAAIATASVDAKAAEELSIDVCCGLIAQTNSLYAAHLAKAIGWDESLMGWSGRSKLRAKVASLAPPQRLLIAHLSEHAGELSVSEFNANGKCEDLEKMARLVGVDPKKVRGQGAPEAKAPEVKQPAKPKKPLLDAAARKRIADAQKKRLAAAAKPAVKKAAKKAAAKKAVKKGRGK